MIHISHGKIDKHGQEYITICVGSGCCIDENGICHGETVTFKNNHKEQYCLIFKSEQSSMNYREIQKIRNEVWTEGECLKYLKRVGIPINQEVACVQKLE